MLPVWGEPPSIDQITDKIYLGNESGAHNQEMLKELKITHILVAGNYLHQKFPKDFKYFKLPLHDKPGQDLFPYLKAASDFIDEGERVLVHCGAGMSRSASIVIAYLMMTNKWSYTDAHEFVKTRRAIVCPNEGFVTQLKNLETYVANNDLDFTKYTSIKILEYKKNP